MDATAKGDGQSGSLDSADDVEAASQSPDATTDDAVVSGPDAMDAKDLDVAVDGRADADAADIDALVDTGIDGGTVVDAADAAPLVDAADAAATLGIGLVAFYPFDETGGTTAADLSGNGFTAAMKGATFAPGQRGNAATMAPGQYVSLPSGIVSGLTSCSISLWVKLVTVPTFTRIFDFGTGTTAYMYLSPNTNVPDTRFAITLGGLTQEQQLRTTTLPTGTWKHIAIALSGATGTLYVNGIQVTSSAVTLTPASLGTTTQNFIGRSQYAASTTLDGQVDEFRIYGRVLTAAEIQQLFQLQM
ncbi:MAG: LamG domain-containing protein [Myxococcota bacterium]|nr:LamG domain-containing protein [Myxococcota bacterium]